MAWHTVPLIALYQIFFGLIASYLVIPASSFFPYSIPLPLPSPTTALLGAPVHFHGHAANTLAYGEKVICA